jgi:uncharacterized protein (DUF983 family)
MPEREFEVEPVGIAYVCDSCGQGEMVSAEAETTAAEEARQAGYRHRCTSCGQEDTLAESYPTIRFRVKEGGQD